MKKLAFALLLVPFVYDLAGASVVVSGWPLFWFPRNELNHLGYEAMGVGIGARGGFRFLDGRNFHPYIFADASYLYYGSKDGFLPIVNSPAYEDGINYHSRYELYLVAPGAGVEYDFGMIRPYAEVFGGYSRYISSVLFHNRRNGPRTEQRDMFKGYAFNYGLGGGVRILVWKPSENDLKSNTNLLVDWKFIYFGGGETEVYYREPAVLNSDKVIFRTSKPAVDHVQIRLGFNFII